MWQTKPISSKIQANFVGSHARTKEKRQNCVPIHVGIVEEIIVEKQNFGNKIIWNKPHTHIVNERNDCRIAL